MEGREELSAREECRVVRGPLHREQQPRHDRQGELLHERRRLSDAREEGPATAGPALLQHDRKLISVRMIPKGGIRFSERYAQTIKSAENQKSMPGRFRWLSPSARLLPLYSSLRSLCRCSMPRRTMNRNPPTGRGNGAGRAGSPPNGIRTSPPVLPSRRR